MARNQQLIDDILAEDEAPADHSLQSKALKRAVDKDVPKTLTPWEWQQWYAENGIPETHQAVANHPQKAWWRRWL